jgi:protocatechuate 3,4-dioxygenase beta subunit
MARSLCFGTVLLTLSARLLKAGDSPPAGSQEARKLFDEAAKQRGPAVEGRITDEARRPLRGAKVILYGGMATRWKIAEAKTGAKGRYRFDSVRSTLVKDSEFGRWDQYVGVRVEHPTHVEADGRSWRDLRIPGIAGHVETLDLKLTPSGYIDGLLRDGRTGEPLKKLDLLIMTPSGSHGHGATFHDYATIDVRGRFPSISLFPGDHDGEVNSTTLGYKVIGRVKLEPGKVATATFDAVSLPRVIGGRVVDGAGKPLDDVEVTLLAPKDSGVEPRGEGDFVRVRTRAWTIFRPRWQECFELAFLPGLEGSRFVLAIHKERGWAKVTVESVERGGPIRLRPWKP